MVQVSCIFQISDVPWIPIAVYACFAVVGVLISLQLPETNKKPLAQIAGGSKN